MGIGRTLLRLRISVEYQRKLLAARWRWRRWSFAGSPTLFANAMLKAGSKLLGQVMEGIQTIGPFAPVRQWPIRTITAEGRT